MRLASATTQTVQGFITDEFDRRCPATDHEKRNENAPAHDYNLLHKSSAVYMHPGNKLQSVVEIVSNTQVFLAQGDDGLPLEDDEIVGILSLNLVDELDEIAVTMLAKVLAAQVCQLILALDILDAGLALLHQFLHNLIPQRDVLCARAVVAVAGDGQRRRVLDIQRHATEALIEAQVQYHVGAEHRLLRCQSCHHELSLHRGLCGQPLQPHLEADRGVRQHNDL